MTKRKNRKPLIIIIPLICAFLFHFYLYFPYSEDLVREKMYEYVKENIPDYQDYESNNFLDKSSAPNEKIRGYAGYMKTYSMDFVHKNNSSLTFEVYTRGFKIESNYIAVAEMLPYVKTAENLFNENIVDDNVRLIEIVTDLTGSFAEENVVNNEAIINNSERFIPYVEVNIPEELADWKTYLKELDNKVVQYFKEDSVYQVKFVDGKEKEYRRSRIVANDF